MVLFSPSTKCPGLGANKKRWESSPPLFYLLTYVKYFLFPFPQPWAYARRGHKTGSEPETVMAWSAKQEELGSWGGGGRQQNKIPDKGQGPGEVTQKGLIRFGCEEVCDLAETSAWQCEG